LAECHYCGRRFPQLYKLTPEDIRREHLPPEAFQVACAECLDRIRLIARVVPEQSLKQTVRNFSWMIPSVSLTLVSAALLFSLARTEDLDQLPLSMQWIGASAALVGILMIWDRSKNRYGFTHDLRWSLNSKRADLAISIVIAGILVLVLSTQFLLKV
jgi:hypothetical protein